jgi:hypothetical protein
VRCEKQKTDNRDATLILAPKLLDQLDPAIAEYGRSRLEDAQRRENAVLLSQPLAADGPAANGYCPFKPCEPVTDHRSRPTTLRLHMQEAVPADGKQTSPNGKRAFSVPLIA